MILVINIAPRPTCTGLFMRLFRPRDDTTTTKSRKQYVYNIGMALYYYFLLLLSANHPAENYRCLIRN